MGRPKKRPGRGDAERVRELARVGNSIGTVAGGCGIDAKTFRRWLREEPEIASAFDQGREEMESALVGALYAKALRGNVTASIFLLKAMRKFVDNPKPEPPDSRVEVIFQLPAPLSAEQYQQLIDVTPKRALREAEVVG